MSHSDIGKILLVLSMKIRAVALSIRVCSDENFMYVIKKQKHQEKKKINFF